MSGKNGGGLLKLLAAAAIVAGAVYFLKESERLQQKQPIYSSTKKFD